MGRYINYCFLEFFFFVGGGGGGLNVGSGLFFLGGGVLSVRDFLRFPVLPHSITPVT